MKEKWTDKLASKLLGFAMTGCFLGIGWIISTEIDLGKDVSAIKKDVEYLKKDSTDRAVSFQNWRDKVDQTLMVWGAKTYKEPSAPYTDRKWEGP